MIQPPDSTAPMVASHPPLLRRVGIKNYRSIGSCDVRLGPLTFLVGRNGSGKSNFLDALAFVQESLDESLDHAIKRRGGIESVRRMSTGHPRNFGFRLELDLTVTNSATYSFEIAALREGRYRVKRESLNVRTPSGVSFFDLRDGEIRTSSRSPLPPVVSENRLFLVAAAGLPEFRSTFDALRALAVYNLDTTAMRGLQTPTADLLLRPDGANIAGVIGRLTSSTPEEKKRLVDFLGSIVDGIVDVERKELGPMETLEFRQEVKGAANPWRFYATSMSDGTLRALGTIVAVSQLASSEVHLRVACIEEPETALHPAAGAALVEALRDASSETQILVTTHSADLIDQVSPEADEILCVVREENETGIGHLDEASQTSIRDHLYSAGELLRLDQLEPSRTEVEAQKQLRLFTDEASQEDQAR